MIIKNQRKPLKMLKVDSISKHFNGVKAVKDVSLDIQKGTITSLIGPNGAGKTTLFNIICGYLKPDRGTVNFQGKELNGSPPHAIASLGIGRTFQNLRVIKKLSALDNVLLSFSDSHMKGFTGLFNILRKDPESENRKKAEELLPLWG
jgi:branched-chain amino acid transport system ATP-binding protein